MSQNFNATTPNVGTAFKADAAADGSLVQAVEFAVLVGGIATPIATALNTTGALPVRLGGVTNTYDVAAPLTIKAAPGRLIRINVIVAGTAVGAAYDSASTSADALTNQICAIPNVVGPISLDWPCATGITIVPGAGGQVLAVNYD
jgi:hypothetical protein